jgi:hypothetical protein
MGRTLKKKHRRGPGFVPLFLDILNSEAYIDLRYSAKSLLPYLMAKVKTDFHDPARYQIDFPFSYTEARSYGFSNDTTEKAFRQLIWHGFIDPVSKGGLRGSGKTASTYKLSERWGHYGKASHVPVDWDQWRTDFDVA